MMKSDLFVVAPVAKSEKVTEDRFFRAKRDYQKNSEFASYLKKQMGGKRRAVAEEESEASLSSSTGRDSLEITQEGGSATESFSDAIARAYIMARLTKKLP